MKHIGAGLRNRQIIGHGGRPLDAIAFLAILSISALLIAVCVRADTKEAKGLEKAKQQDCFSCHAIDHEVVGPAWIKVAQAYAGQPNVAYTLAFKVINGGVGHWGNVPMPAHPKLSQADATLIVKWILTLKGQVSDKPGKTYSYKNQDGKPVTLHFQVFAANTHQVTDNVFAGYEKYNSYCYRCHGPDAVGGEYAPDLRKSLSNGMSRRDFCIVAMEGKKDKGMPDWAGFFSADEMEQIYQYVRARQLGLIGAGRPLSAND